MHQDTYRTINKPTEETLYKVKGSKFFGYVFPVATEDEIKNCLVEIRKQHHTARHVCYAYQIGVATKKYRANDDGEPSNSAGMPIYGQIQSFDVTNILVISVRYFGGVKLGVGGLISAYKTSAQLSLERVEVIEKTINVNFLLKFGYDLMNSVQRIIKEKKITIEKEALTLDCEYLISVRKKESKLIFEIFDNLYQVSIKKV